MELLLKSDLFKLLKLKGLDFQIHSHEPLFTVEDSEKLRGQIKGAHTKNLFLKSKVPSTPININLEACEGMPLN